MFYLVDDGTLDTVMECSKCLTRLRYSYDGEYEDAPLTNEDCDCYEQFVDWAFQDAEDTHEC